ncbi:peptide ABC transporter ATP-binding protein [Brachybacterium vulturis]|uniref:Peptide ABC transporter ATP-binding protein n=1 Tax=Brachybacterium vulturis TaxID=2017484 RepID=A0A291GJ01_9MICO|nr:ABC transporter ATP-binding protein [Brachybacterium vulturis]ATG50191.1 peptide ABC transporter ATP-binding protein [Brachybacterium vulturis]
MSVDQADPAAPDRTDAAGPSVLRAENVSVVFDGKDNSGRKVEIHACREVDVDLRRGEIVALVGESGSGKSTLARAFSLVHPPTAGQILLDGEPIGGRTRRRPFYKRVQLIYQDPFASLNSLKSIRHILGRVVKIHTPGLSRRAVEARTLELLELVSLTPAEDYIDRFPSSLSGGQRQRVSIARALAVDPDVLLADEPTSMLDVSIRLDVLNLLDEIRRERGVAILYITHDIASARYISDRMAVMYSGELVETGPTEDVVAHPKHPYTRLLIESAPDPSRRRDSASAEFEETSLGEPADPAQEIAGCRFQARCPFVMARCRQEAPPLLTTATQHARCWLFDDDADDTADTIRATGAHPSKES